MKSESKLTPLMKQYWDVKTIHPDKIVFFRMGDFFELFYDDATTAAPILGLHLTQRNKKSDDYTPMCGMPHFSVGNHINKLLSLGHKVAICDQIEDPKHAVGIVKRAVTRILTPGVVFDPSVLDESKSHYVACIDEVSIAFCDFSTGESYYFETESLKHNISLLKSLNVAEVLIQQSLAEKIKTEISIELPFMAWSILDEVRQSELLSQNPMSNSDHIPTCAQLLWSYVHSLGDQQSLKTLTPFVRRELSHRLKLHPTTIRHLEVFANNRGGEEGTLFACIDRTKTPGGRRLLRNDLLFPLTDLAQIQKRLNLIDDFRGQLFELKKSRELLGSIGDIERRLSKISLPQCSARDILSLTQSLLVAKEVLDLNSSFIAKLDSGLNDSNKKMADLFHLVHRIQQSIKEDAPVGVKNGEIFRKGFDVRLDELISLSENSSQLIEDLEKREKEATGISSLKVRYNNVFGYYIEITNTHKEKAPAHYSRKQTLTNAERFCTDELLELEKKVLSAQGKRFELEYELFQGLRSELLSESSLIHQVSVALSRLDVTASHTWLSLEENYVRPEFSAIGNLKLMESRHPVVEQSLKLQKQRFVPNTIEMKSGSCDVITGPNMAGKSTLMRQVALTAMLAQIGSFVPASLAEIPIYDSIFTRIGASDHLAEGLSTFMVEMKETADMLANSGSKSLLIMDEIGRGTATYDGLSIAQAILEYVLTSGFSQVFFATHYHELTDLPLNFKNAQNKHMSIHISQKTDIPELSFLYLYEDGPAGASLGVEVAKLAGLPKSVTDRAQILLDQYQQKETAKNLKSVKTKSSQLDLFAQVYQEGPLTDQKPIELMNQLKLIDLNSTTPLEALKRLSEWKEKLI